jgi:DNA-binding transcriptional ArsR family regulator
LRNHQADDGLGPAAGTVCGEESPEKESVSVLRLHLAPEDFGQIRFACSPLWEAVLSYLALQSPGSRPLQLPWVIAARQTLRGVDLSPLDALLGPDPLHFPDFLTPTPTSPLPEFATELELLRATPATVVRDEVLSLSQGCASPPANLHCFLEAPDHALMQLVGTLARYWDRALAMHWPQIQQLLEADILGHAQRLVFSGPEALFADLHPDVRYRDGVLEVGKRLPLCEMNLDGRGLLLVPVTFAWPDVYVIAEPPWPPALLYSPRGVANLWSGASPPPDALCHLVGEGRARVLSTLVIPRTTTEIARQLGLTAGAVSQHLARLQCAGVIAPRRSGRRVYYGLTARGGSLIDQFDLSDEMTASRLPRT